MPFEYQIKVVGSSSLGLKNRLFAAIFKSAIWMFRNLNVRYSDPHCIIIRRSSFCKSDDRRVHHVAGDGIGRIQKTCHGTKRKFCFAQTGTHQVTISACSNTWIWAQSYRQKIIRILTNLLICFFLILFILY